ncbi:MAG: PTS sugar transporter subunit IIA [Candidatus Omnitrophica bacterium]|nr:PTS sugar transporter subunit IIA [Candidatus Omnitrophota bacterium]
MEISDFLNSKAISVDLQATDKENTIKELLGMLVKAGAVKDEDKLFKILISREALGSTGIGQGVGIPHGKTDSVSKLMGAFGISKAGVNFDSLDGEPTYIFFLLLAPEDSAGPHLKALAKISRLLKDKFFRDRLMKAKSPKEIIDIISKEEAQAK